MNNFIGGSTKSKIENKIEDKNVIFPKEKGCSKNYTKQRKI